VALGASRALNGPAVAEAAVESSNFYPQEDATMGMIESRARATSDPGARKAVLEQMGREGVDYLLLWFTDIEGHLKSFAITLDEVEGALDDGMGFDGSSITGFNAIEESDMIAIPDPGTFSLLPSREGEAKVGRMICDVVRPDGDPYEGDPRYVLRRALERMQSLGFDTFNVGPELEYFLFEDSKGTQTLDEGGYFAMTALDAATELRYETIKALEQAGIPIEYHHHEVAPSQHEIDMRYASALDMADYTVTYRLIVKEVAAKNGVYATFMPKPLFGENGSGMHTHMSLFKDGRNQFFDGDDAYHLSPAGKHFIAGLLHHAREVSAVFAQWVNSYKRLVPGYEAPVYVAWSQRNRSALVRIPLYKPGSEQATRAELRCPDPACNPYLTFAALLHAGLEGIERGYELADPMDTNLYHLTAEQRRERGIVALPETLGEAIDEFASSDLMRRAFGDHIFDNYVKLKRQEWDEYRIQLTKWELDNYLSVL
jgi:glutamine synthetase